MKIAFQWENGGSTPTRYMTTHISTRWFAEPIPENFDFADYPKGDPVFKMFVGPKAFSRSAPIVITARDILAIYNHSGHLYLWGWARYHDIFLGSPEHITCFCAEITDVHGDLSGLNGQPVNIQTANCNHGNCYDDECKIR